MFKKLMSFRDNFRANNSGELIAFKEMARQIKATGGGLHFVMKTDNEGWFAVCQEFPQIVTGGSNTNPSEEEIMKSMIESIKTAFDVPITELKDTNNKTSPLKIELRREFCFA